MKASRAFHPEPDVVCSLGEESPGPAVRGTAEGAGVCGGPGRQASALWSRSDATVARPGPQQRVGEKWPVSGCEWLEVSHTRGACRCIGVEREKSRTTWKCLA